MAEWLKAHAWKACLGETLTRVRIPLSPPSPQLTQSHRQRNDRSVRTSPGRPELTIVGPHLSIPIPSAEDSETAIGPIRLVVRILRKPLEHFQPEAGFVRDGDWPHS